MSMYHCLIHGLTEERECPHCANNGVPETALPDADFVRVQRAGSPALVADLWVCGCTKRCGWSGEKRELVWVLDKRRNFYAKTGSCPKCGGREFHLRQRPMPENDPKVSDMAERRGSCPTEGRKA